MTEFLKCDAPNCDHREDVHEISEELVGKPCPKCGADLLTREDFDFYVEKVRPAHSLLAALGFVKTTGSEPEQGDMRLSFNAHAGELNIKIQEIQ